MAFMLAPQGLLDLASAMDEGVLYGTPTWGWQRTYGPF